MTRPRRSRLKLRSVTVGAAALAAVAAPAYAAFTLDGTTANVPGNLQPAGEPSVVLGGLKGVGNARVPWLAQTEPNPGGGPRQVFVEKFAGGAFSLQGDSLNFNPAEEGNHPSIDFAGANSSVPWTAWEEDAGGVSQIFASKFNPNADLQNGVWEINGALRTSPGSASQQRGPTLNFNPDRGGDDPSLAGGTTVPGGTPAPWVIWKEDATPANLGEQIFVTKGVKDSAPSAAQRGSFTWHIQGTDRGPAGTGPTLNVQISKDVSGEHPDITFTGAGSTVPWAVWYEEPSNLPPNATPAAPNNQKVFAAKFVPDPTTGDRGGHWIPVGNAPTCAFSASSEDAAACLLNKDPSANAENPNVAAGSLDPAKPTVPWVAWHESAGSASGKVFLSRLVPAENRFALFAGPNPDGSVNADPGQDADEPDLHFEGNVLIVTWKESVPGGTTHVFARRFTPGPAGQGGTWSPAEDLQVDPSLESGNPSIGSFGGSPFVAWAEGSEDGNGIVRGHTLLKHDPANVVAQTGAPTAITGTSATLAGAAAGDPGVFAASFDVTAGGQTRSVPAGDVTHNAPDPSKAFTAALTGLAPNSVVQVRAKLATALGVVSGPAQNFVTAGSGAPGALGLPPVARRVKVTAPKRAAKIRRVRVAFTISRKWKVSIVAHKGTKRGPIVGRLIARFHKGRNIAIVPVRGRGRVVFVITPRAGKTILKAATVR
jgi:hypothetical protein